MEKFTIIIDHDKQQHHFQIGEYPHHDNERCRYRVFENGQFVASFEPDAHHYLHICQQPGLLTDELLYKLADEIEAQIPYASSKHFKDKEDDQ